jgi:signal transduction histidine kinase
MCIVKRAFGSVFGASVVCVFAWIGLAVAAFGPARVEQGPDFAQFLLCVVPLGLGWLIAVRAPGSPVGAAMAWLAAFMLATPAVEAWGETAATDAPWWGSGVMSVIGAGVWPWQLVGFMALLLVFPDGLLPGRRWTTLVALVPASALLVNVAFVLTMNYHDVRPAHSPVAVPEVAWLPLMFAALGLLLAVVVACIGSVVVRYRRGGDRTRQQLRWLILAAGGVAALMAASWVVNSLGRVGAAAYNPFLLGIVVLVPAAVSVAVLRHDLFEIDRILSDSVAWALTTVVAAAMLAVAVVGVGYLLGRDSLVGLTGAVFLVALAFLPLHRRIHRMVGRLLDRDRTVILERIQRFVEQVRDGSAEPESVEAVLRAAADDPDLALLLTDLDGRGYVDLSGSAAVAPPDGVRLPLRAADADIGVVVVSTGSLRRVRRARLAASAARLPIEVSRLRLGLRRALQDVADSRRRLVSATIDERKRLERDLHDGTQQQLVAVGMQLRAAQRQLPADHPVVGELDQTVARLEDTVAELRRLAHGVRPASLDDGLSAALGQLCAACPLPVDVEVDDMTAPDIVVTTAYFVVAEAVANVLKHARATRVTVTARQRDGSLHVSVSDDGVGGAPTESGPMTLRDRVGSIGGTLAVTSGPGAGTTIEAVLPCAS